MTMRYSYIIAAASIAACAMPASAAPVAPSDTKAITDLLKQTCFDKENNKIDGTTGYFKPDILVYDLVPPLISTAGTVEEGNHHWHKSSSGGLSANIRTSTCGCSGLIMPSAVRSSISAQS